MENSQDLIKQLNQKMDFGENYYQCLVIVPEEALPCFESEIKLPDITASAKTDSDKNRILPEEVIQEIGDSPIVSNGQHILIIHSEERLERLDPALADLLSSYLAEQHCCMGVSQPDRHKQSVYSHYQTALSAIRLGRLLDRKKKQRIYYYQDFSTYYLIDLAAKEFFREHQHGDLVLLMHPSIIHLARYDRAHNTNLREVLFHYLLCDKSISKAAKKLYMHRNTVLNKLARISEITDIAMDDERTRHQLILSCLILRYYQEVLHREPDL